MKRHRPALSGHAFLAMTFSFALLTEPVLRANPSGGQVVAGSAAINQAGSTLTIQQQSQRAIINWDSFSIGAGQTTTFVQPSASAAVLNRVTGGDVSAIHGALSANGQVWLINPNGVLVGSTGVIDTAGFLASTANVGDSVFLAGGDALFSGASDAKIVNLGRVTALDGDVVFIARRVENTGVLSAPQGAVALAGGTEVLLKPSGAERVFIQPAATGGAVENSGRIAAATAELKAAGGNEYALAINNPGAIRATGIVNEGGRILLKAATGTVRNSGVLSAEAAVSGETAATPEVRVLGDRVELAGTSLIKAAGGFVDTSGREVSVAGGAIVDTRTADGLFGIWLIDPTDFYVTEGGGAQTASGIGATTLATNLATGNVTLQTSSAGAGAGDIYVNSAVTWNAGTRLTLDAHGDIFINASITANHASGALSLFYGQGAVASGNAATYHVNAPVNLQAGQNFQTKLGSDGAVLDYTVITALGAAGSTTGTDLQGMNGNLGGRYVLGANIDASGTALWNGGSGFNPIGAFNTANVFSGTFDGLGFVISNLTINRAANGMGLFGETQNATIRNVGLAGGMVSGNDYAGALVGYVDSGTTISNTHVSLAVAGGSCVGGLVGFNGGAIRLSYATGTVSGTQAVGGFAGAMNRTGALIEQSYATGSVTGSGSGIGGFIGYNTSGSIRQSYASGAVSGTHFVGGFAGAQNGGTTDECFSTGAVTGVVGFTGGFIGSGFTGTTDSYWATDSSGKSASALGTGLTLAQLEAALPGGFDSLVWGNADNQSTPYIKAIALSHAYIDSDPGATNLYRIIQNVDQLQLMNRNLAGNYALGNAIDASATSAWNGGQGFSPVGTSIPGNYFTGRLDGLGYAISGLTINRPAQNYVGLFGATSTGAIIRDLGLLGGSITGQNNVGGLVGNASSGNISRSYVTANVTGTGFNVGGLVGYSMSSISQSYATGDVLGTYSVGGLTGANRGGISYSYATGDVTGDNYVGGLTGFMNGEINQSYATGNVSGTGSVGGLAGISYGEIDQSYAIGNVSGSTSVGRLMGSGSATVTSSYWNSDASISGGAGSSEGTGVTLAQMKQVATFAGWDIDNDGGTGAVWRIYEGHTTPLLRAFLTVLEINVDDATVTYNGTTQTGGEGYVVDGAYDAGLLLGSDAITGGGRNAGDHSLGVTGVYSGQQGYDIQVNAGTLTVEQADLTITASHASKTYGDAATLIGFTHGTLFDGDTISGVTLTSDGAAATAIVGGGSYGIVASDATGSGLSNYDITYVAGTLTVTQRAITVTVDTTSKIYGENDDAFGASITGGSLATDAGDTLADVTGLLTRETGENVGAYDVLLGSGAKSDNYTITFVSDNAFTITPRALTVTAADLAKIFGTTYVFSGTEFTADNLVNGDEITSVALASVGADAAAGLAGSPYAITIGGATGTGLSNYDITYVDGALTINNDAVASGAAFAQFQSGLASEIDSFNTPFAAADAVTFTYTGKRTIPGTLLHVSSADVQ